MPYFPSTMRTKNMLLSRFYASMGVRGYYSPFFAEAHVNPLFLEHERFPVKAHELAHLGGITSEAEANLIAYLIATNSDESEIQFDGNMFILSYVIRNARNFLPEEEYKHFLGRIDS